MLPKGNLGEENKLYRECVNVFYERGATFFSFCRTHYKCESLSGHSSSGSSTADYCPLVDRIECAASLRLGGITLNVIKDYIKILSCKNKWVRWMH